MISSIAFFSRALSRLDLPNVLAKRRRLDRGMWRRFCDVDRSCIPRQLNSFDHASATRLGRGAREVLCVGVAIGGCSEGHSTWASG